MGKRITREVDLPDWFDTGKYEGVTDLDARGWYEQLCIRETCYDLVSFSSCEGDLDELPDWDFGAIEFLAAVRANPLFPHRDSQFREFVEFELGGDYPGQYQLEYPPGIVGITPMDIREIVRAWDTKLQDDFLTWLQPRNQLAPNARARNRPPSPIRNWAFRPLKTKFLTPITINPYIPDKVLRKSLDQFVSGQRARSQTDKNLKDIRSNTFLEWCNCGLLQYLDLMIWATQVDTKITNKALAYGIFPNNYEKGEENIRTTTKKHAAIVLERGTHSGVSMSTLYAYSRLEDFEES